MCTEAKESNSFYLFLKKMSKKFTLIIFSFFFSLSHFFKGRHDIQHNDIQHKDTHHTVLIRNTQHKDTQHKGLYATLSISDSQHK
jgi:hypothetical protein